MALKEILQLHGLSLNEAEELRLRKQLRTLNKRLANHPEPTATLVLRGHPERREVEANLRVQLGPAGGHLISHQSAETAGLAVRQAVDDVERQLERRHARQRGEPAFGVPSRRLPRELRPNPGAPPDSDADQETAVEQKPAAAQD